MSWKKFIQTSGKWLLLDLFLFHVTCTMSSLYYINIYSKTFSIEMLSLQRIIQSSIGFLITSLIVYKAIEYVRPNIVLLFATISYPILFLFMISNEAYLLCSAITGTIFMSFVQVYQARIRSENIQQEHRVKWNNISGLVSQVGIIVGSGIGSLSLFTKFPFWLSFMTLFIMFDIGTIMMYILIRKGKIKY